MTTVSSHALQPHTAQAIKASRSWSLRALQIADGAIQAAQGGDVNTMICNKALAVGSYNLGMLAEVSLRRVTKAHMPYETDNRSTVTCLAHLSSSIGLSRSLGISTSPMGRDWLRSRYGDCERCPIRRDELQHATRLGAPTRRDQKPVYSAGACHNPHPPPRIVVDA